MNLSFEKPLELSSLFSSKGISFSESVILIPVYSSRSKKTGLYDLNTDGNFERSLHILKNHSGIKVLVVPNESQLTEGSLRTLEKILNEFENLLIFHASYGQNASETRKHFVLPNSFLNLRHAFLDSSLTIIFEPESELLESFLHKHFLDSYFIYFCPVSSASGMTPYFLDDSIIRRQNYLMSRYDSWVLSLGQKESFPKSTLITFFDSFRFFERIQSGLSELNSDSKEFLTSVLFQHSREILYFPFRQSDSGYDVEKAVQYAEDHDMIFCHTAPNDFIHESVMNLHDKKLGTVYRVSSKFSNHAHMLFSFKKVTIPYLEDFSRIYHTSFDELLRSPINLILNSSLKHLDSWVRNNVGDDLKATIFWL